MNTSTGHDFTIAWCAYWYNIISNILANIVDKNHHPVAGNISRIDTQRHTSLHSNNVLQLCPKYFMKYQNKSYSESDPPTTP